MRLRLRSPSCGCLDITSEGELRAVTLPNWNQIVKDQTVSAPQRELWVKVCDFVRGPRRLRIEAAGTWSYEPNSTCGPDGSPAEGFEDGNLHKAAVRGCLLAKVGGSCGDTPGDGKIQAVGSYCVFEVPDGTSGALFLTMNDSPKRFHMHGGELKITLSDAPIA